MFKHSQIERCFWGHKILWLTCVFINVDELKFFFVNLDACNYLTILFLKFSNNNISDSLFREFFSQTCGMQNLQIDGIGVLFGKWYHTMELEIHFLLLQCQLLQLAKSLETTSALSHTLPISTVAGFWGLFPNAILFTSVLILVVHGFSFFSFLFDPSFPFLSVVNLLWWTNIFFMT